MKGFPIPMGNYLEMYLQNSSILLKMGFIIKSISLKDRNLVSTVINVRTVPSLQNMYMAKKCWIVLAIQEDLP
ncbi:Uncharacterised protein [Mycobacterium tuberculosis]|nr:Uncharacterised protein [Mycobacterium tuberculosis]